MNGSCLKSLTIGPVTYWVESKHGKQVLFYAEDVDSEKMIWDEVAFFDEDDYEKTQKILKQINEHFGSNFQIEGNRIVHP